jgi:transketolase
MVLVRLRHLCCMRAFIHRYTALKPEDIVQLKSKFGLDPNQTFHVPQETYTAYGEVAKRGAALENEWTRLLDSYSQKYPKEHAELIRRIAGKLPDGWEKSLPLYKPGDAAQASRKLSEIVLTHLSPVLPELLGGSADLTSSNLTKVKGSSDFQHPSTGLGNYAGTYIRYGVREHGMGAISNGIAAYGPALIPFVGTFLVCIFMLSKYAVTMLNFVFRTLFHMPLVLSGYLP